MKQSKRLRLQKRLEFTKAALAKAEEAYLALLDGGVQSYTIGSRSLTKLDLDKLKAEIDALNKEIDMLEAMLSGGSARKAVGVVPMDW